MFQTSSITTRYKKGDVREDGRVFLQYDHRGDASYEKWGTVETAHRQRLQQLLGNCKRRSRLMDIPFDLDIEHLLSIFPEDFVCPISGETMQWGETTGRCCSPSLDRIIPKKGYTKDNVVFISMRMNRMKQDASIDELQALIDFYKPLIERKLH